MGPPDGKKDISRYQEAHRVEQGEFILMIFVSLFVSDCSERYRLMMYCAGGSDQEKEGRRYRGRGERREAHAIIFMFNRPVQADRRLKYSLF